MKLLQGDCIEVMKTLDENSVDTIITDPPYGLNFMGKDWDKFKNNENPAGGNTGRGTPYARNRVAPAFYHYGAEQMATLQGFTYGWATEALRVAKPGAMMFCFGGTRTFHRIACGIEDAGWEIRDTMMYLYGSGFPKSYNISKGIMKKVGDNGEVVGKKKLWGHNAGSGAASFSKNDYEGQTGITREEDIVVPVSEIAQLWDGWGTALKPAHEPIIIAMKPYENTYVENALKWGVAGLNVDGGRVPTDDIVTINTWDNGAKPFGDGAGNPYSGREETKGRWPANIIHDGSEEVVELFPQTKSSGDPNRFAKTDGGKFVARFNSPPVSNLPADSGSAARFFYCAKASKAERNAGLEGSCNHPTVKPLSLMEYLCRLSATPTGGIVLDPFMGSGTTGMACKKTGRDFIGIELDPHYFEIAEKRISSIVQVELI